VSLALYQAAWLDVSDSEGEDEEAESDEEEQEDTSMLENIGQKLMDAPEDEMGGEIEEEEEEEEEGEAVAEETEEEHRAAAQAAMLERRKAREQEDLEFPDEVRRGVRKGEDFRGKSCVWMTERRITWQGGPRDIRSVLNACSVLCLS
jgi:hypothetical protein